MLNLFSFILFKAVGSELTLLTNKLSYFLILSNLQEIQFLLHVLLFLQDSLIESFISFNEASTNSYFTNF